MAVSHAEDRCLAEIVKDCAGVLDPGIELLALEREVRDDAVRLVAAIDSGAGCGGALRSARPLSPPMPRCALVC